jgi:hypothetical protein
MCRATARFRAALPNCRAARSSHTFKDPAQSRFQEMPAEPESGAALFTQPVFNK